MVERWLGDRREVLGRDTWVEALFVSRTGRRLSPSSLNKIFTTLAVRAGVPRARSPHPWRHAAATHMLEEGADLRDVQAYLEHSDVRTTAGYTHVGLSELRRTHAKFHPFEAVPSPVQKG